MQTLPQRHGRACPGHPRLAARDKERGSPGMTTFVQGPRIQGPRRQCAQAASRLDGLTGASNRMRSIGCGRPNR
ncbi:MAG: hypothetical protein EKK33_26985 [Bradyrhizobiaceae bacterium]|nr:MAG: hypothetical protein EKK33_26985 [Bradyrhizobiaceae bacterium]